MDMYAFKCDEGYLKISLDNSFTIVSLQKASVYWDIESALSHFNNVGHMSSTLKDLRIAKLQIIEEDYYEKIKINCIKK